MRRQSRHPRSRVAVGIAGVVLLTTAGSAGYVVRPGDTLTHIAARHGTTVSALLDANAIADPNRILAGQELTLPGTGAAGAAATAAPAAGTGQGTVHVVGVGDSLWRIAARYGVAREAIAAANGLADPDHIQIGQRLTIPVGTPSAPTAGRSGPTPAPAQAPGRAAVERLIGQVAAEYGWDAAWIKALAWQESGWQQSVRSPVGAVGIMQVMPGTGRYVARSIVGRPLDLTDPRDNVVAGVAFLDHLYDLTGGDVERALAGYYQGLGSVSRNGMYPSTVQYVRNVVALKARFD